MCYRFFFFFKETIVLHSLIARLDQRFLSGRFTGHDDLHSLHTCLPHRPRWLLNYIFVYEYNVVVGYRLSIPLLLFILYLRIYHTQAESATCIFAPSQSLTVSSSTLRALAVSPLKTSIHFFFGPPLSRDFSLLLFHLSS